MLLLCMDLAPTMITMSDMTFQPCVLSVSVTELYLSRVGFSC